MTTTTTTTTATTTARLTYLVHYPRDFANEYAVYAGTKAEIDQLYAILDRRTERGTQLQRITRKDAVRLGYSRVREAAKYGEQWFGGFAESTMSRNRDTLAEMIADARQATLDMIEQGGIAVW